MLGRLSHLVRVNRQAVSCPTSAIRTVGIARVNEPGTTWAGAGVPPAVDERTGKIRQAQLFLTVLGVPTLVCEKPFSTLWPTAEAPFDTFSALLHLILRRLRMAPWIPGRRSVFCVYGSFSPPLTLRS